MHTLHVSLHVGFHGRREVTLGKVARESALNFLVDALNVTLQECRLRSHKFTARIRAPLFGWFAQVNSILMALQQENCGRRVVTPFVRTFMSFAHGIPVRQARLLSFPSL